MADDREVEPLRGPPRSPPRDMRPRLERVRAGQFLRRIYAPKRFTSPTPHVVDATTFRFFGPLDRFDHHGAANGPAVDPGRGIYYAGVDLWDCAVEVFSRTGIIRLADNRFAEVVVMRDLELVDLRGNGAIEIGSTSALAKRGPRSITQAWSRYVYENRHAFARDGIPADGLLFLNSHNDGESLALFERASQALRRHSDRSLRSNTVRVALEKRAMAAPGLTVEP
jgi:RES domain-containing protein